MKTICVSCGAGFQRPIKRGRPPTKCEKCRGEIVFSSKKTDLIIPFEESATEFVKEKAVEPAAPGIIYNYYVLVSNVKDPVYAGDSENEANIEFRVYEKKTAFGFGQVGNEIVYLYQLDADNNKYKLLKKFNPLES